MNELNKNRKQKGWFKIGNIFIDEHAKNIGYTAAIVYLCIKRYMNNQTRSAFPSEELIAKNLCMDRRTVIRAVKKLEGQKFIVIEKKIHKGRWAHNTYRLTHSKEWLIQPCDKNADDHMTNNFYPSDKKGKIHVDKSHTNNTHNNNTKISANDNGP
jgi:hypothetical protein